MLNKRENRKAILLVEWMLSLVLFTLVAGVFFSVFNQGLRFYKIVKDLDEQERLNIALYKMEKDFKSSVLFVWEKMDERDVYAFEGEKTGFSFLVPDENVLNVVTYQTVLNDDETGLLSFVREKVELNDFLNGDFDQQQQDILMSDVAQESFDFEYGLKNIETGEIDFVSEWKKNELPQMIKMCKFDECKIVR